MDLPPLHLYSESRQLHLWRNTNVRIAGRGAALCAYVKQGSKSVMVRDLSCPRKTAELRASAGVDRFGMAIPSANPLESVSASAVENPIKRLRAVWLYRVCNPAFRAEHPMRLCSVRDFGAFLRWVTTQDPLAVDTLIRPQWAMIPDGAELTFIDYPELPDESPLICKLCKTLYQDDFDLWGRRNVAANVPKLSGNT